jgi:hypothetical protein
VVAEVPLLLTSIFLESSAQRFFCNSFSWALLEANFCVRQLRVFCFPVSQDRQNARWFEAKPPQFRIFNARCF